MGGSHLIQDGDSSIQNSAEAKDETAGPEMGVHEDEESNGPSSSWRRNVFADALDSLNVNILKAFGHQDKGVSHRDQDDVLESVGKRHRGSAASDLQSPDDAKPDSHGLPTMTSSGKAKFKAVGQQVLIGLHIRRMDYKNYSPESNGLSNRVRHSYCAPTFSTLPVVTLLAVYLTSFYESLGVSLGYLSFFIALARSLDVLSDPLMSYITDSFRSQHGRRRPFCITGCWLYAACLMALLSPPDMGVGAMSSWFGAFYILFFLMNTFTTIPYDALGPELTDNEQDRSRLFFVSGLYDGVGALVAITLPQFCAYITSMMFTDCDEDLCYGDGLVGYDCVANVNDGTVAAYNLTDTTGFAIDLANVMPGNYSEYWCAVTDDDDQWPGLANYCDCLTTCATRCSLEASRSAYAFVGFFFGAWFCVAMVNLWLNVKERGQKDDGRLHFLDHLWHRATRGKTHADEQRDRRAALMARQQRFRKLDTTLREEGAELQMGPSSPMIPSLLNTFRNKPFTMLLPAWICDSIGFAILASMITYFVRYVIQPEYMTEEEGGIDCNEGVPVEGRDSDSWMCSSTYVLGALVTSLLIAAFLGTPFWLLAARKLGKRRAWLLWSFVMAITNILFAAVGKGDVVLGIVLGAANGFPFGAKFLADAILTDTIDYDEFLTGQRNEATYMMFKSFLPKICAIPAAAIPLAFMEILGHVAPVDGRIQEQPAVISTYCFYISVVVPFVLSLLSFYFKYRFPLTSTAMVEQVAVGVGLHKQGLPARDPISGEELTLLNSAETADGHKRIQELDADQRAELDLIDYFPGTTWLEGLLETQGSWRRSILHTGDTKRGLPVGGKAGSRPEKAGEVSGSEGPAEAAAAEPDGAGGEGPGSAAGGGEDETLAPSRPAERSRRHSELHDDTVDEVMRGVRNRVVVQMAVVLVLLVGAFVAVVQTFSFLNDTKTSVVPILMVIVFGTSLTFTGFCALRLRAAAQLYRLLREKNHGLTYKFVRRLVAQRKAIDAIGRAAYCQSSLFRDARALLGGLWAARGGGGGGGGGGAEVAGAPPGSPPRRPPRRASNN